MSLYYYICVDKWELNCLNLINDKRKTLFLVDYYVDGCRMF